MSGDVEAVSTVETVAVTEEIAVSETVAVIETVEVGETETIAEEVAVVDILTVEEPEYVIDTVQVSEVLTEGMQGPPGNPGISEDDVVYAKRLDMVSSSVFYKGEAAVGSTNDASVWRIRKVTLTTVGELVDMAEQWADGDASFTHSWDERLTYTYI